MGSRHRVTLSDVARRAGVSTTTASYVVNGRRDMRISEDATRRVLEAAASLGYRPNRNALSLRTARTKTVGLISDFVASGHFGNQMLSGASAAAREIDHLLLIGETEGDPGVEEELMKEMLDRQVDGIVYARLVTCELRAPRLLAGQRAVLLNCTAAESAISSVMPDETAGGRAAAQVLLDAGHRSGIHVVGEDPTPQAMAGPARLAGVVERLREAGAELAGVVPCDWDVVPAFEAVGHWLSAGARPRALVCLNDRIAMGVYQALEEHRLVVPDDVSVVSFDASDLSSWLRPALTSVGLPYAELGRRAVQVLMDGHGPGPARVVVPMPVRRGRSVGPPG